MIKIWDNEMPYKLESIDPNINALDSVDFEPYMQAYPAGSKGAVIVLPGGGYVSRSQHEGTTFGEWFRSIGITAFVLQYRVAPNNKHVAKWTNDLIAWLTLKGWK